MKENCSTGGIQLELELHEEHEDRERERERGRRLRTREKEKRDKKKKCHQRKVILPWRVRKEEEEERATFPPHVPISFLFPFLSLSLPFLSCLLPFATFARQTWGLKKKENR